MSVRRQLRASGLFARETERRNGTTTFYLTGCPRGPTIYAERSDREFDIRVSAIRCCHLSWAALRV